MQVNLTWTPTVDLPSFIYQLGHYTIQTQSDPRLETLQPFPPKQYYRYAEPHGPCLDYPRAATEAATQVVAVSSASGIHLPEMFLPLHTPPPPP